jgi:hypothetical protein
VQADRLGNEEVLMNRMAKSVILLPLVVCFLPGQRSFAQQNMEQKSATKEPPQQELRWETLEPGVRVLKLWNSRLAPGYPQVAILEIEKSKYEAVTRNLTEYFEDHAVFERKEHKLNGFVSKVDLDVTSPSKYGKPKSDPPPTGMCRMTAMHTSWTTSAMIASCY